MYRVHWNGDSLEVHGTNPQWEHLAIDDTWDADPAGLPVVNVAGVPDIGCAPDQPTRPLLRAARRARVC